MKKWEKLAGRLTPVAQLQTGSPGQRPYDNNKEYDITFALHGGGLLHNNFEHKETQHPDCGRRIHGGRAVSDHQSSRRQMKSMG
jgi:hypothetical protein